MTRSLHAAGCITRSSSTTPTQHIWISDAVLADTFRAFTSYHTHRRRASSVPGPLEARRRASKRKNTNLAYTGSSATPINPAILLGSRSQDGWWKQERVSPESGARANQTQEAIQETDNAATGFHWSWLFKPPAITARQIPPTEPVLNQVAPSARKASVRDQSDIAESFKRSIHDVSSLEDIRSRLHTMGTDIRQTPYLVQALLQHMLDSKLPFSVVAEFVCAPEFNPPGSSNCVHLLQYLERRPVNRKRWNLVTYCVLHSTRLGLIMVDDLKRIVEDLRQWETTASKTGGQQYLPFLHSLLRAIEESRVLRLEDLGPRFLEKWVRQIQETIFLPSKGKLVWKLRSYSGQADTDVLEFIIRDWLQYFQTEGRYDTNKLVDTLKDMKAELLVPTLLRVSEKLVEETKPEPASLTDKAKSLKKDTAALEELVRAVRHRQAISVFDVEPSTSEENLLLSNSNIFDDADFDEIEDEVTSPGRTIQVAAIQPVNPFAEQTSYLLQKPSKLELWWAVLGQLDLTALGGTIWSPELWNSETKDGVSNLGRPQRALSRAWTALALTNGKFGAAEALASVGLKDEILNAFRTDSSYVMDDVLARIILALASTALPAKDQLVRHLKMLTNDEIVSQGTCLHLYQDLENLMNGAYSRLEDPKFYKHTQVNYPTELQAMSESVNSNLNQFGGLSQLLIKKSRKASKVIIRILRHNRALSLALHTAWKDRLDLPDSRDNRTPAAVDGNVAVELIHDLANAFATSRVLSQRSALRKVYWCYLYLHRYGGPIRPAMSKALWHTGVTRAVSESYNGSLPSLEAVQFLYNIVRTYEGEDTAKEKLAILLQSTDSEFGRKIPSIPGAPDCSR